MNNALEIRSLRKSFGSKEVLHGVDFSVAPGSIVGLIGPNGAGKTTTMRCLLDVIRPSAGAIKVLGEDPRIGGPELRRRIGYLPGELILEGRITGRKILEHFEAISGPVKAGKVEELAQRLGLDLDNQARRLSKGNKQKLGLIQAFMHEPELLVLDEPTSGLDPLVQQEFLAMIHQARDNGQTVLLSSHVLSEIQQAADEVVILRDGHVATVSTVEALRATAIRHVRVVVRGVSAESLGGLLAAVPGLKNVETSLMHDAGTRQRNSASAAEDAYGKGSTVQALATLHDGVGPLIGLLAGQDVLDLVIEEPDLEEAVLKMYSEEADPVAGRAPGAESDPVAETDQAQESLT